MTNHDLFHAMGGIDARLLSDAAPDISQKKNIKSTWIKWGMSAACFCLLIVSLIHILIDITPNQASDIYREGSLIEITSIDELPAEYYGTMLVENLDFEKAEFYYNTDGAAENVEDWYSLLISQNTQEYVMTVYCMFGDTTVDDWKVSRVFTKDATDLVDINGVSVQIARNELSFQYEYWYYAIFEYDNIVYDIRVESNNVNSIYNVLNMLLRSNP